MLQGSAGRDALGQPGSTGFWRIPESRHLQGKSRDLPRRIAPTKACPILHPVHGDVAVFYLPV
jgi:hypothetical protein